MIAALENDNMKCLIQELVIQPKNVATFALEKMGARSIIEKWNKEKPTNSFGDQRTHMTGFVGGPFFIRCTRRIF